jgi:hypothetical protein
MASARKTGTNEQVLTYGSVPRDYDDGELDTWEAATDTDHVTDTETDVLEVYDDAASFDDGTRLAGSTNDASYHRIVRPATGQGHDGTSNNGCYFSFAAVTPVFRCDETFSQVQDMICTLTVNNADAEYAIGAFGANSAVVGCIAFDGANAGAGTVTGINATFGSVILCLSENNDLHGIQVNGTTAYNCVAVGNGDDGFQNAGGTCVLKNCLSDGNGGDDFEAGTYTGSDYNASSDATDPDGGGNNRQNQTFTYKNSGGNDYHLTATDAGAKGFGVDLSGDGTYAFDDDIDGDTMSDWPIGFHEPTAAIPVFSHHYTKNIGSHG